MSVRVTIHCKLKSDKREELMVFLVNNLPNVRGFEGCYYVDVLFDESRSLMLLDEQWESVEHHQAYIAFIEKNGVLNNLASFLTGLPQIQYFKKQDI